MSNVDEIDGLKIKQQESQLNQVSTNSEVEALRRNSDARKKRLEYLERYSRDFNIRVLGVNED